MRVNNNKHHIKDIFWANVSQGILIINHLLLSIIIIRLAGKEIYGDFLFIFAIVGALVVLSVSGIRTVILRTVAQGYEKTYSEGTKFSFIRSLIGVPIILLIGLYFFLYTQRLEVGISLIVASLIFPFFISLKTWMFFLEGKAEFKKLAFYNALLAGSQLTVISVAVFYAAPLVVIVATYILIEAIFNAFYTYVTFKKIQNDKVDKDWEKQSYIFSVMDLSSHVFGKADVAIMGMFLSPGLVAVYSIVMKIAEAIFLVIKSTITAILPKIYKKTGLHISYFYKYIVLSLTIPIFLFFVIQYPILFLYGIGLLEAIFFTRIYLFVVPIYFLSLLSTYFLIREKLNRSILVNKTVAIVVVLTLYLILIPNLGILGGVIASMIYFLIQAVLNTLSLNKIYKEKFDS
jgi:O-antigen/teichoic acid export membrane protein